MIFASAKNVSRHELVGTSVKIIKSPCKSYLSVAGRIIDETKNMFIILQKGKPKEIPKMNAVFRFNLPNGSIVDVDGSQVEGRLENRIKKTMQRKW
ncbi:MAG: ribonuclease P protein subunit [Candidatus Bathyarchaeota archaeon]